MPQLGRRQPPPLTAVPGPHGAAEGQGFVAGDKVDGPHGAGEGQGFVGEDTGAWEITNPPPPDLTNVAAEGQGLEGRSEAEPLKQQSATEGKAPERESGAAEFSAGFYRTRLITFAAMVTGCA